MKKVLLLLIVLVALIGIAVLVQKQQDASLNTSASTGKAMRELLLPGFDSTTVQKVRIKDASNEVNVTISADRKSAAVAERAGYPASLDKLNTVFTDLAQQKIASKIQVRKGAWADVKVQPPGEGTGSGVGTLVEMLDGNGAPVKAMVLGSDVSVAGGRSENQFSGTSQRYVRVPEDGDTIWAVSNTFLDLDPKPESWLDKGFIDVQKIRKVTVTLPKPEDSWSVSRADENATDYTFAGAKEGESFDSSKVAVGSLLSSPSFNDVHGKDKTAELLKDAAKAKIETFDGFTYDVQVAKVSKDGADKYYMTVAVAADIPKARTPAKDEKEEDKKKKDDEFAARKKTLEEKLAKEQKFAGWVYEVSEYTVNNLLKKRNEVVKSEPKIESPPAAPGSTPPAPSAPTTNAPARVPVHPPATTPAPAAPKPPPVSVTTPPVSVTKPPVTVTTPPISAPPMPKEELKPTPDPKANPATGTVPASTSPPAPATATPAPPPAVEKK